MNDDLQEMMRLHKQNLNLQRIIKRLLLVSIALQAVLVANMFYGFL